MPIWDRDWYRSWFFRGKHPPTCTCVNCTKKRLGKSHTKYRASEKDATHSRVQEPIPVAEENVSDRIDTRINKWVLPLLIIFAISVIGVGISMFAGTFIPFWVLLGFSIIFSIEQWYRMALSKKVISRLYRLALNLSILALLGYIVWYGINLFSHRIAYPMIGSFLLIFLLGFFIYLWRVVSRNSWRFPSMKLTVSAIVCICTIFAFAGVQPLAGYKDTFIATFAPKETLSDTDTREKPSAIETPKAPESKPAEAPKPAPPPSQPTPTGSNVEFEFAVTGVSGEGLSRTISAQLTNTGTGDAHNVWAKVEVFSQDSRIKVSGKDFIRVDIGMLKSGAAITKEVNIQFGIMDGLKIAQNGARFVLTMNSDEKTQELYYDYQP